MRYHHKKKDVATPVYGDLYYCDHPVYSKCTLYKIGDHGLTVIQQRYSHTTKRTWWGRIDPYLQNEIYMHKNFMKYFNKMSGAPVDGLYPTVTVRQIMWGIKMKPLRREPWETVFDHAPI